MDPQGKFPAFATCVRRVVLSGLDFSLLNLYPRLEVTYFPHMKTLPANKAKSLKCSKQAQGTLTKVVKMVEEDRYCPEIIQQVDSVIGLLKTAKRELLAGHLDTCAVHQLKSNKKKAIEELLKIYNLSN